MSDQQVFLHGWLRFYSWVTSGEGPPIPDDVILNNDTELDDYVTQWSEEQKAKAEETANKSSGSHKKSFKIG